MRLVTIFVASLILAGLLPAADPFPPDMDAELRLVLARYSAAVERQQKAMLGATMEADIGGKLTGLEKEGRWRIARAISRVGEITFRPIANYIGDGTVKDKLIAKYLEEEQKAKAFGAMKVNMADYDFAIRAKLTVKGRAKYIFDVKPKRDFPGAFKGEVHVDGPTGMPLREAGQLEESPSVWLSKIKFSREYEMMGGISVVKTFRSSVHVRLLGVGQAELNIDFSNVQLAPENAVAGEAKGARAPSDAVNQAARALRLAGYQTMSGF